MSNKKIYFCGGCRQIHYDKDKDIWPEDGDLEIDDWEQFLKSIEEVKKQLPKGGKMK